MKKLLNKVVAVFLLAVLLMSTASSATVYAAAFNSTSRGTQVRYLQQNVTFLGYSTYGADGIYGNNTKDAVKKMQKALHLTETGIVDEELDRLITGTVADIQRYLVKKGYLTGAVDGIKGNATGNAFKKLQKDLGYEQTGVVSLDVLKAILSDSSVSVELNSISEWVTRLEDIEITAQGKEKQYPDEWYLELFRKCPMSLDNEIIDKEFNTYISIANSALESKEDDTLFGAILTGLSKGKDIIWNEVISLFGGEQKSYKEQMRFDAISCLMRDICGTNNVVKVVAEEVGNSFEALNNGYTLASEATKTILVKDLAEACTSLSYATLGDIVDTALAEAATGGLECVDYGIDTVEYIIGLVQLYEIDNLTLSRLQKLLPSDCNMYADLELLKQERNKDQVGYFVEHFMTKGVQELLCSAMSSMGLGLSFPANVVMTVTEISIDIFAKHIYQGALSEELIQTLLMKSYVNTLKCELDGMQTIFQTNILNNKVATIEEIKNYEFLYTAYLAAVMNYMISAKKMLNASDESLLGKSIKEIDELQNYDRYIALCIEDAYPELVVGISEAELYAINNRYKSHGHYVKIDYSYNTESIVRDLQILLNAEDGYSELEINGVFDSSTYKAVCSFQTRYGLKVDGIAGKDTWTKLYEVLCARIENIENGSLDVNAMLDYAKLHWNNYNTSEYLSYKNSNTDCCNYVSQILCAGGLGETKVWHGSMEYADITDTFDYIPDFIEYMRKAYDIEYCTNNVKLIRENPNEYDRKNFSIDDIEVGDCITYDVTTDKGRDHIMFVIGVNKATKTIYYTAHTNDRFYGISEGGWISFSIVDGLLKTSDISISK